MKHLLFAVLVAAATCFLAVPPVAAQQWLQFSTCGMPPRTLVPGSAATIGVDLNGNLCIAGAVVVTPSGTQNVNITQILGAAPSLTNPLWITPATGATFQLGAGTANVGNVGGTSNVTPVDCSGTITSGGTAQNAFAAQSTLRGYVIMNLDTTEGMWISFTGTAAASTAGSYFLGTASTISGGGSFSSPLGYGQNTALSVVAATTAHKFSCTRW